MSLSQIISNLSPTQKQHLSGKEDLVLKYGAKQEEWPEEVVLTNLCEGLDIPLVSLGLEMVDVEGFRQHREAAIKWRFLPLYCSGLLWVVATAEPWNEMYLRQLRKAVEKEIRFVGISETDFDRTIAILTAESGISNQGVRPVVLPQESEAPFETWDIREDNYRATVREMVEKAYRMQVSDIILDPMEDRLSVRFRIHGRLEVMPPIELKHMNGVIMEIKLLSRIPTSDVVHFKSGRASIETPEGTRVDLRCEVQPTHHGESVILRLLDPGFMKKFAGSLPFTGEQRQIADYCLNRTKGLILVTGPTGSGKTTTLYSCLTSIDYRSKNVRTLENPVEYAIDGIVQSQVGSEGDSPVTFLDGLRSHMRADPDVILVGEIRDEATALAAFRAALTGHLVLSTLHTNDSIDSLNRLMDLGVSPYLIKSTLLLVIAQRLVPKLCSECHQPIEVTDKVRRHYQYYNEEPPRKTWVRGGCPACFHTGVSGRLPIFEFFFPSENLRDLIRPDFRESDLRKAWRAEGGTNLVHGALPLVSNGTFSYDDLEIHETEYVTH